MGWGSGERTGENCKESLTRFAKRNLERKWGRVPQSTWGLKFMDDHQYAPFEKLWGFSGRLCVLGRVIVAFLLCARCHTRCHGTKMRKTQSCLGGPYRLVLRHTLEEWTVPRRAEGCRGEGTEGKALIYKGGKKGAGSFLQEVNW